MRAGNKRRKSAGKFCIARFCPAAGWRDTRPRQSFDAESIDVILEEEQIDSIRTGRSRANSVDCESFRSLSIGVLFCLKLPARSLLSLSLCSSSHSLPYPFSYFRPPCSTIRPTSTLSFSLSKNSLAAIITAWKEYTREESNSCSVKSRIAIYIYIHPFDSLSLSLSLSGSPSPISLAPVLLLRVPPLPFAPSFWLQSTVCHRSFSG